MTTQTETVTAEAIAELKQLAIDVRKHLGDGDFAMQNSWIVAPSKLGDDGGTAHVGDIRGWGYLTGRGLALRLDEDEAWETQKTWGKYLITCANLAPLLANMITPDMQAHNDEIRDVRKRALAVLHSLTAKLDVLNSLLPEEPNDEIRKAIRKSGGERPDKINKAWYAIRAYFMRAFEDMQKPKTEESA